MHRKKFIKNKNGSEEKVRIRWRGAGLTKIRYLLQINSRLTNKIKKYFMYKVVSSSKQLQ